MALPPMPAAGSVAGAFSQNLKLLGFTHPSTCEAGAWSYPA